MFPFVTWRLPFLFSFAIGLGDIYLLEFVKYCFKWEKLNISKTTYQKPMKIGMFPHTIILFYFTVCPLIRILIIADMSKIQTR